MALTQITLEEEVKDILDKRKMKAQAKVGHPLTWAEYLLEVSK